MPPHPTPTQIKPAPRSATDKLATGCSAEITPSSHKEWGQKEAGLPKWPPFPLAAPCGKINCCHSGPALGILRSSKVISNSLTSSRPGSQNYGVQAFWIGNDRQDVSPLQPDAQK